MQHTDAERNATGPTTEHGTIAGRVENADVLALEYQKSAALRAARVTTLLKQIERLESKLAELESAKSSFSSQLTKREDSPIVSPVDGAHVGGDSAAGVQSNDVELLRGKTIWQRGQLAKLKDKNSALGSKVDWLKGKLAKNEDAISKRDRVIAAQSIKIYDLEHRCTTLEKRFSGYLVFRDRRSVRVLRSFRNRIRSWRGKR